METSFTATSSRVDTASTFSRNDRDREAGGLASKRVPPPKAPAKSSRIRNFFQRSHEQPKREPDHPALHPVIARQQPTSRSVAHYALPDAGDQISVQDLEQIFHEADALPDATETLSPLTSPHNTLGGQQETIQAPKHGHSILLPSPPIFSTHFLKEPANAAAPKLSLQLDIPSSSLSLDMSKCANAVSPINIPSPSEEHRGPSLVELPPQRPSRLPQVGRIPRVVSKRERDRERKLSIHSFSRPFATQPSPAVMQSPVFPSAPEETATYDVSPANTHIDSQAASPVLTPIDDFGIAEQEEGAKERYNSVGSRPKPEAEFMAFPPSRKNSEISSSSSGTISFPIPTAIIPPEGAPLSEDEVWNEYDDLLDAVLVPHAPRGPLPNLPYKDASYAQVYLAGGISSTGPPPTA
ncbi:hypothetical protein LTS18_014425, partial [Coniosporium uncinatum]